MSTPKREKNSVGLLTFQGLRIRVETRKGEWRIDRAHTPPQWKTKMRVHYGEIVGTVEGGTTAALGVDGDKLDVFVGPNPRALNAYAVRQLDAKTGAFDEQKFMLGFDSEDAAKKMYLRHYDSPDFFGGIRVIPMPRFLRQVNELRGKQLLKSLTAATGESAAPRIAPTQKVAPLGLAIIAVSKLSNAGLFKSLPAAVEPPTAKPGEACPHCGAMMERGDDGKCNTCRKPWPLEKSLPVPPAWPSLLAAPSPNFPPIQYANEGAQYVVEHELKICTLEAALDECAKDGNFDPARIVAESARRRAQADEVVRRFYNNVADSDILPVLNAVVALSPVAFQVALARIESQNPAFDTAAQADPNALPALSTRGRLLGEQELFPQ